jgi:hypothetical protein
MQFQPPQVQPEGMSPTKKRKGEDASYATLSPEQARQLLVRNLQASVAANHN